VHHHQTRVFREAGDAARDAAKIVGCLEQFAAELEDDRAVPRT
jgi:hypothetical protein